VSSADPLAGFQNWLDRQADYPAIADRSPRRIYVRGAEAAELLARAWAAGWATGSGVGTEDPQSAPNWRPDTGTATSPEVASIIGQAAAELAQREHALTTLAGVTGCPAEWITNDGHTHMCILLSAAEHDHLCQCGALGSEAEPEPDDQDDYDPGPEIDDQGGMSEFYPQHPAGWPDC